jgi:hypothetical protein
MQGINSLVLIIFFEFFVYGNAVPKQDWKPEEITKLMTLLMNYGEHKLQEYNSHIERKEAHVNQFLVASVLSESEMTDSRNWQHIPESITKDNARIDVIFNDENYKKFPYRTKKPLHGEVLMLLEREDLPKMIINLNEAHRNTYPFVVLYSHYIPCCDVKGVEYSCSEELANAAISNHDKYTMLVGYKELFQNTNTKKSLAFMNMGGIKLFRIENKVFQPVFTDDKIPNKQERILQDLFYKCLDITPASDECCIANNPDDKKKILSMYVNNVVYMCTSDSLKSYIGKLTPANTLAIMQCMHNYVEQHTNQDCPKCAARTTKTTIKVCALYASEFGTEIGRPSDLNNPYLPEWGKGPLVWSSLYQGYNINADVNLPQVFCLKRPNDIKTMCTKLSITKTEITDVFRGREKLLKNELKNKGKN